MSQARRKGEREKGRKGIAVATGARGGVSLSQVKSSPASQCGSLM